tara:strand:+ start:557 stop:775 length:219 start_codon:yes stop_codon:yes gene_type:complete
LIEGFIFLGIIAFCFVIIGLNYKAEIIISPIFGFVIGALYNKEYYDDGQEITLQCLLGIISISIVWENQDLG